MDLQICYYNIKSITIKQSIIMLKAIIILLGIITFLLLLEILGIFTLLSIIASNSSSDDTKYIDKT